jgi:hypothetical protein
MGVALDVIVVEGFNDLLDHLNSFIELLFEAGGVEDQVADVLPFGVDWVVFFYC